jgi:hypothetical protein
MGMALYSNLSEYWLLIDEGLTDALSEGNPPGGHKGEVDCTGAVARDCQ